MTFLGYPVTELFLFFILYSFLGWLMETCYCSILQRRLVPRGFLYGPICPIYGIGVLIMILIVIVNTVLNRVLPSEEAD